MLEQGSADFIKGQMINISTVASSIVSVRTTMMKVVIANTYINSVPIKLYLWPLKLEFHAIFMYHEMSFF